MNYETYALVQSIFQEASNSPGKPYPILEELVRRLGSHEVAKTVFDDLFDQGYLEGQRTALTNGNYFCPFPRLTARARQDFDI